MLFTKVFHVPLKTIEKTDEDIENNIFNIKQRVFEHSESIIFPLSNHISEEIFENILENKVLVNIPPEETQNHSKMKIMNPFALKSMNFLEENYPEAKKQQLFWPEAISDDILLYGTKTLYVFLRFFYTFYEQMSMAYQLSRKFEKNIVLEEVCPLIFIF